MGEDISFNLEYFAYVQSAYILNACLYHYVHVTRSQSISSGYYPGYYDNVCMVMQREKAAALPVQRAHRGKRGGAAGATSSGVCPVPFKMILPAQNVICAESTVPYAQSFLPIPHRRLRAAATQPDTYIKFWLFGIRHRWYLAGTFLFLAVSFTKLRLPRLVGRIKGE